MRGNKSLILGTAMWGWSVEESICFKLLDFFYKRGFREIDTATNYPIDKDNNHFRYAENVICKWIKTNGIKDIKIIVKVGSLSNDGTADNNLRKSFLLLSFDYYLSKFNQNLHNFMIHWDNRNTEVDIRESLEALKQISMRTEIGLSGIKYPIIHASILDEFKLNPSIEIRHNIINSNLEHYRLFKGKSRLIAYGINMGGIKLSEDYQNNSSARLRKLNIGFSIDQKRKLKEIMNSSKDVFGYETQTFNHLNMIYTYDTEDISGVIIGPSNLEQLQDSLDFWEHLKKNNTVILYSKIKKFADEIKSN